MPGSTDPHVTCTVTDGIAEVRLDRPEELDWLLAARNTSFARRAAVTGLLPEFGPRQR